tara:strand:- start:17 stop:685 length:669 start_codon:yes stop_codon:yes gene_type:complete
MIRTKIFDFIGKEFPKAELITDGDYHKAFINHNNQFQKIETYENQKLIAVNAFINDISEIDNYFEIYPILKSIEFDFFLEKKGHYSKYENYHLNRNQKEPDSKRIHVYGSDLLPIYDRALTTDNTNNKYLWKHLYYSDLNVEFEFVYDANGKFKRLTVYDVDMIIDSDNTDIYPENVGIGKNDFNFNWEGLSYYKNAEPVLPEKEITTHNNAYILWLNSSKT